MEECLIVELFDQIWAQYPRERIISSNRRTCYAVTFEALDYAWLLKMQWHRSQAVLSGSVVIVDRNQPIVVDRFVAASYAIRRLGSNPSHISSEENDAIEQFVPLARAAKLLPRRSHIRLDGELKQACQTFLEASRLAIQLADEKQGYLERSSIQSKIEFLRRKPVPETWTLMEGLQGLRKRGAMRRK